MIKKIVKYLILFTFELTFILNNELNGVYNIKSFTNNLILTLFNNRFYFRRFIKAKYQSFRITPIISELYKIESVFYKKNLGVDEYGKVILLDSNHTQYWNIIKINDSKYLIQNNYSKNFLENKYVLKCENRIENIQKNNTNEISNNLKFLLFKLYEEVQLKPEYIKFIEEEPVDVLIKYIDLSDKTLKREGIHQIEKDEDHEELRYCVRSILENIPWIRKIFILMPNEKVSYFKPIEEIKERIVYVKDKDFLGFDSANIFSFQFSLFNMSKFGLSENFILMDDDYFIGKPINKTQFFYYDENLKKVVPAIVSDELSEIKKVETYYQYEKLFSKLDKIDPHDVDGWQFHTLSVLKLFLDNFELPLVNGGFTHNAISCNLNDSKEIYEFLKDKYEYFNETLYSKTRPVLGLQTQTLFNTYAINVKKRKVNIISRIFIDLKDLKKANLDYELFVINTSGGVKYSQKDFDYLNEFLNFKFNKRTPYEIITDNKEFNDSLKYTKFNKDIFKIIENTKNISKQNDEIKNEMNNLTEKEKNKYSDEIKNEMDNHAENETNKYLEENGKIKKEMNNHLQNKTKNYLKENGEIKNEINNNIENGIKNNNNIDYKKKYYKLYFYFKFVLILLIIIILVNISYFFGFIKFKLYEYQNVSLNSNKKTINEEENNNLNINIKNDYY